MEGIPALKTSSAVEKVTLPSLQQMKRERRKIAAVVAWDFQIAQIVDRIGVEIVSVGDSVGQQLWGQPSPLEVTLDEMIVVCKAVRRGVARALVSCDFPPGVLPQDREAALQAAQRLAWDAGADLVKIEGARDCPDVITAIAQAGIPVFAQMEPVRGGDPVADAMRFEAAGAALIDFKYSGPDAGAAVAAAVAIPVLGGLGGGPWLDGRLRMAHAAIGYAASNVDAPADTYANVARTTFDALSAYVADVRAGRQIRGATP
jgi:3-methyl-2-oxobutanoate hydroxymethyltransferase